METQHLPVSGTLQMKITDGKEIEDTTTHFTGDFYHREKMDVLTFQEENDDDLSIKNLITIHNDKVSIKRTGDITMHQQFRVNQITEDVFKHPHVNIHMETYTNKLKYQAPINNDSGKLSISFTVKLDGQEEREHQLNLLIKEDS
ncbi:hypothetical protein CFK37_07680 [Virgibacillus phasianinus]|uniref:DUF1934 domain-containing protein n=1 Tax=Virgibacillus phasianinus TaxID=2017483 RepID=A0A220U1U9_9BACI|nr:DUF1934 domain-containing protein [Virgibacillus phasianinus]ASK62047.1 hypothetical protein CFK37_07680 [Virgibacillus phasianinus]